MSYSSLLGKLRDPPSEIFLPIRVAVARVVVMVVVLDVVVVVVVVIVVIVVKQLSTAHNGFYRCHV